MKLFISYSSKDRDSIQQLAKDLDLLDDHQVWFDQELNRRGGQEWWELILAAINDCEAFIYALSPHMLQSEPCRREYSWARSLGKPVLALIMADVEIRYLPLELQKVQLVDYRQRTHEQQKALKVSLRGLPPAPALPDPLPTPPDAPLDPVGVLHDRITRLTTNYDEQLLILLEIDKLRDEERFSAAVPELLQLFMAREDVLTVRSQRRAKELLGLLGAPNVITLQPDLPKLQSAANEQERLLTIMLDPAYPPSVRAEAGRDINQYGDPRPGVGLRPDGLPDIAWCDVPANEFTLGSNKYDEEKPIRKIRLPNFQISKYLITYQQFGAFVIAEDGYRDKTWWRGLHEDGFKQQKEWAGEQAFQYNNHPRENVSWYEALAFTRWLSAKLKLTITLPTEDQWEAAARGTDGREYPWGNEYKRGYANIDETFKDAESQPVGSYNLNTTAAVGIYPQGASPYQVLDMSGNVSEWTLDEYHKRNSDNLDNRNSRSLRGGDWVISSVIARAAARDRSDPDYRDNFIGFRVVLIEKATV